jgi:hypothetical protein
MGMPRVRNLYEYPMGKLIQSDLPILCWLVEPSKIGEAVGICWRCNCPCGKPIDSLVVIARVFRIVGG